MANGLTAGAAWYRLELGPALDGSSLAGDANFSARVVRRLSMDFIHYDLGQRWTGEIVGV